MTDRKRRKTADALSRLTASVEDIRSLGEELSQIVKPDANARVLSLRVVPTGTTTNGNTGAAPSKTATSLMSLVTASALRDAVDAEQRDAEANWRGKLTQVAKELASSDPDAEDRCSRLLRRVDSLAGTVKLYEAKLQQQTSDAALSDKIESRLEVEERAWEKAMAQRERRVAELEEELRAVQQENEDLNEEQGAKDDADADVVMESEVAVLENQSLREALALRMEEKRDIEAAIQSLRRKKRRHAEENEVAADADAGDRQNELRDELKQLMAEKEELKASILAMEAEQEESEAEQQDVADLKAALEQSKSQRQQVQDELDKHKHVLSGLKTKMKHMVDVQLLSARDTNPPTLSEEMAILHLLYEHEGEMDMNALKQATTELLATYGKTTSSAAVLRAIYSLVGSLAVHIDRSIGNGVVTSLLV